MPKGRRVPAPGERMQTTRGTLVTRLDPIVRGNLELLAREGFTMKGRGLLMVELNEETDTWISGAAFYSQAEMNTMNAMNVSLAAQRAAPPMMDSVESYDPAREYVVMVVEVTPTLANPVMRYEVIPLVENE